MIDLVDERLGHMRFVEKNLADFRAQPGAVRAVRNIAFITAFKKARASRQDQSGDSCRKTQRDVQRDMAAEGIAAQDDAVHAVAVEKFDNVVDYVVETAAQASGVFQR